MENEILQLRNQVALHQQMLEAILVSDKVLFKRHIELLSGRDIKLGTGTGTKIGTATTQKLGFYNATPIVQRSGAAQAAIATTGATQTTPWGFSTEAQANAIVTLANELRAWAVAIGFIKGSV